MTPSHGRVGEEGDDVADRLLPAVVNISVSFSLPFDGRKVPAFGVQENTNSTDGANDDSVLLQSPYDHGRKMPSVRQVHASGSGFVIDPSGVIVTNHHVIEGAQQIDIIFQDGTELPARLVGYDSQIDLAVLQVTPRHKLAFIPWGRSDAARIGEPVLAVGSPMGLKGTVTAGIISSRGRDITHEMGCDDFIQTDAAINPGNSGGPLLNSRGEVIGINTLIYGGAGGGSVGLGFAIPSDDVSRLVEQIRRTGHTMRTWVGLGFSNLTRDMAETLEYRDADGHPGQGIIINCVHKNSPAEKAHLEVGDVLVALDGKPINSETFHRLVARHRPGDRIVVQVWRRAVLHKAVLTPVRWPGTAGLSYPAASLPAAYGAKQGLGLKIGPIDMVTRAEYDFPDTQRGVLVISVSEGGVAENKGLVEGNVILRVGQEAVDTPEAFLKQIARLREKKKDAVLLLIQDHQARQDKRELRWVLLRLGAAETG